MNLIAIIHLISALVAIVAAIPLMRGKIKMNSWYGVRIPAAFTSETAWFAINRHGGRLLLLWGLVIAAVALVGIFLQKKNWIVYNWTALVIISVGLVLVLVRIYHYSRKHFPAPSPKPMRSAGGSS